MFLLFCFVLCVRSQYVCHAEVNAILNKNSADVRGCTVSTSYRKNILRKCLSVLCHLEFKNLFEFQFKFEVQFKFIFYPIWKSVNNLIYNQFFSIHLHLILYYIILYHNIFNYIILFYFISCHIILYYAILFTFIFIFISSWTDLRCIIPL